MGGILAIPPLTFAIYAVALNASAKAGDQLDTLRPFVGLSFAFVIATILTSFSGWQMAPLALGAVVCSVWPGIILLRAERPG